MKLYSTPQSVKNKEPTILAIAETLIAVLIIIWVTINYPTSWNYIILAFALSPLLLLTTVKSVQFGLLGFLSTVEFFSSLFKPIVFNCIKRVEAHQDKPNLKSRLLIYLNTAIVWISACIHILVVLLLTPIIKFLATTFAFLLHPIKSIRQIPRNWFRYSFCTDLFHTPELLMGLNEYYKITKTGEHLANFSFSSLKKKIKQGKIFEIDKAPIDFITVFYVLILVLFGFIPALIYRWSLKSTSIFYSPFIWIINVKSAKENELNILLEDLTENLTQKIRLIWALIIIFIFSIIPFILSTYLNNILPQKLQQVSPGILAIIKFYMPIAGDGSYTIDSWHISRFLCALLTIIIFFLAEKLKNRIKYDDHSWDKGGFLLINFVSKFRFILFSWTLLCGIFIAYSFMDWSHLPYINWVPEALRELINLNFSNHKN